MDNFYSNAFHKTRPNDPDASNLSEARLKWFAVFEKRLRNNLPPDLNEVIFEVVGSTAKGKSGQNSDIDVIVRGLGSSRTAFSIIRQAVNILMSQMNNNGEHTYNIDIHEPGDQGILSQVSIFLLGR